MQSDFTKSNISKGYYDIVMDRNYLTDDRLKSNNIQFSQNTICFEAVSV